MKDYRRIYRFVYPYWGYAVLNIMFNILCILFSLVSLTMIIPFLGLLFNRTTLVLERHPLVFTIDSITNNFYYYLSQVIVEYGKTGALYFISALIVVLFFFRNLTRYMAMYVADAMRNFIIRDIRNNIYHKVLILPIAFFTEQKKGDIMSRMSVDVNEVDLSVMGGLLMLFRDPINILLYLVTLFLINPGLTLVMLLFLPASGYLISLIGKRLNALSTKGQRKLGVLVAEIEETIHGLKIIKAFNAIHYMNRKFRSLNESYTRLLNRIYRVRDLSNPLTEFLVISILAVIIWYGGRQVLSQGSGMRADVFLFYLAVFSQLLVPAKSLITAWYWIQRGIASLRRIDEVMEAGEVITQKPDAFEIKTFESEIEYRGVGFIYSRDKVLDQINLKIAKGQKIAIVGPSGGGKSTLVDLLPRFYDCTEGSLLIDGKNIRDYVISDIRGMMGIVTQESILFNDTVYNNIAFGLENVSEERVIDSARVANAHEFIMEMPFQYQTIIGDRGIKMSGGQRQRLSIARAILRNPPILILDEATSALDTESERLVQEALSRALVNRTSIIVAHRLSTVQSADLIIVLKDGKIAEQGTHSELILRAGLYSHLVELQMAG